MKNLTVLAMAKIDGGAAMDCDERARFEKAKAELTRGGGLVSRRFEWCKNWRDIFEEWDEILGRARGRRSKQVAEHDLRRPRLVVDSTTIAPRQA